MLCLEKRRWWRMWCGFMRGLRWSVRGLKVSLLCVAVARAVDGVINARSWNFTDTNLVVGLLCFYNEKVDIKLDGEWLERPKTPFS
jgi:hypothetical protein